MTKTPYHFPEYFIPDRAFVESLRSGDFAPDCFGNSGEVAGILFRGDDVQGRAFVGFTLPFGASGATITGSLKEGELHRSLRVTAKHTSTELDRIERAGGVA